MEALGRPQELKRNQLGPCRRSFFDQSAPHQTGDRFFFESRGPRRHICAGGGSFLASPQRFENRSFASDASRFSHLSLRLRSVQKHRVSLYFILTPLALAEAHGLNHVVSRNAASATTQRPETPQVTRLGVSGTSSMKHDLVHGCGALSVIDSTLLAYVACCAPT